MIEREVKHIKFSKSEIKKMRDEIAEMIKQGRRDKIPVYHIELGPSARKFVNLNHILFLPDGYIHGKEQPPRAISGWIVDPEGNKVLPAFVKIQKIVSPSKYTTQLIIRHPNRRKGVRKRAGNNTGRCGLQQQFRRLEGAGKVLRCGGLADPEGNATEQVEPAGKDPRKDIGSRRNIRRARIQHGEKDP